MPRKVQVLLVLLAVITLLRIITAVETGETKDWIGAALYVAFIYGLMAGSEGTRSILRFFAGAGVVISLIALVMFAASGMMVGGFGLFVVAATVLGLGVAGFMYWCLGQEDVIQWIVARKLRDAAE
ncbi:MAG: hypothetical protein R3B09_34195 [Nannocystaceae bacterium]